ncbi:MAG: T9SS type A sorting domain-containing protein [Bacteroidales bacterium]|nr:T9SS type A sorting domain-containing protein [Bacteroidales bacterium]
MCINNALMEVVNTILWDNAADSSGNQIFLSSSHADFHYCDIQDGIIGFHISGDATYTYENNLETDPLFLNSGDHPYTLSPGSECINAGIPDTSGLNLPENDLAGNSRITSGRIDIGAYEWQEVVSIRNETTKPKRLTLSQNYPNPFKEATRICYQLPEQSNVSLVIFDMLGKEVRRLVNLTQDDGYKSVQWNATDNSGKTVDAGTYLYQIQVGENVQTKRMVLVK